MSAATPRDAPGGAAAFPWDEAMGLGLGRLGLSPRDFWTMTPREFARAIAPFGARAAAALTRAGLAALMQRFPDKTR